MKNRDGDVAAGRTVPGCPQDLPPAAAARLLPLAAFAAVALADAAGG